MLKQTPKLFKIILLVFSAFILGACNKDKKEVNVPAITAAQEALVNESTNDFSVKAAQKLNKNKRPISLDLHDPLNVIEADLAEKPINPEPPFDPLEDLGLTLPEALEYEDEESFIPLNP